jgi:hypothetical protein
MHDYHVPLLYIFNVWFGAGSISTLYSDVTPRLPVLLSHCELIEDVIFAV